MFLTKLLVPVVFIAIGISIGIQFGSIQVPDDFERPWLYRLMFASFNVIGKIVSFSKMISIHLNNVIY